MTDGRATRGQPPSFTPEITGLRTLALVLVVVYHVWVGRVSGGVDVFLMISAYLLTRGVLRRSAGGSPPRPLEAMLSRLGRLAPPALVVIVAAVAASWLVLPEWRWPLVLEEARASALYVQNLHLQHLGVDYQARESTAGLPVLQHFWSLSVQGQVFVLWPLLHALTWLAARLLRVPFRAALLVTLLAVVAWSLPRSIQLTEQAQAYAYFDLGSRLWEFALGSMLALLPRLRLPRAVAEGSAWAGIAVLCLTGVVLDVRGMFPGWAALVPLTGAVLVLVSVLSRDDTRAAALLRSPGARVVGDRSYALYLTHWPVLVLWMTISDVDRVDIPTGGLIILISAVLAALLHRTVEVPLAGFLAGRWDRPRIGPQGRSRRRSALALAASLLLLAPLYLGTASSLETRAEHQRAEADAGTAGQYPPPQLAQEDWAELPDACPAALVEAIPGGTRCEHLAGEGRTVVLLGSSHMQQHIATVLDRARESGWSLVAVTRDGCQVSLTKGGRMPNSCVWLWQGIADALDGAGIEPDLVVLPGSMGRPQGDDVVAEDVIELVDELRAPGRALVALRDTPRFERNIFACGQQHGTDDARCVQHVQMRPGDHARHRERLARRDVTWVDLTEEICPHAVCRPTRGTRLTYIDSHHLSRTFAERLATPFDEQVAAEVSWWAAGDANGRQG